MEREDVIRALDLDVGEVQKLEEFARIFPRQEPKDIFALISESTDAMVEAQRFVNQNPELVSRIIRKINKNPELLKETNPAMFEYMKGQFPIENPDFYIPPLRVPDPMDPVTALPAAVAVAVVAAALMFVGRGGLRGIV